MLASKRSSMMTDSVSQRSDMPQRRTSHSGRPSGSQSALSNHAGMMEKDEIFEEDGGHSI